ncbi:hypothetical protein [Emticicia sp. BO119]|nr:hypothetical protein [Emticicia sp. BO119]MBA4852080.1 hypothetical protein [Emticicia sp. BO119]
MMADAPQYHYESEDKSGKPKNLKQAIKLTNENAAEMMEYLNKLNATQ